jgi:hypothetical protein
VADYTSGVLSPLQNLNWRSFLARPSLPPLSAEALNALRRQPILITGSIGFALALRLGSVLELAQRRAARVC